MDIFPSFVYMQNGPDSRKSVWWSSRKKMKPFRLEQYRFKKIPNLHFSKGVSAWFLSKKLTFFQLLFICKMHREKVFGEVLERKCSLLDWNIIDLTPPPPQICIFLKGLVHGVCQRFDIIFCNYCSFWKWIG